MAGPRQLASLPRRNPSEGRYGIGTRPEVIKLAPVIRALEVESAVESHVISTGQHREMLRPLVEQFELNVDVDLGVMRPAQRLTDLTAVLVGRLGKALRSAAPDWVVVQGDTTTVLCAALAAYYEDIPVAHVEVGFAPATCGRHSRRREIVSALACWRSCTSARLIGHATT